LSLLPLLWGQPSGLIQEKIRSNLKGAAYQNVAPFIYLKKKKLRGEKMDTKKRSNNGYEIIESHRIRNRELVIGHNAKAPDPYVCWICKDKTDYIWGRYCKTLKQARNEMTLRIQIENRYLRGEPQTPQKGGDNHER